MKTKSTGIRITLTREELQSYFAYLGGRIGQLQCEAAIQDKRPSEISPQVEYWRMTMDKLEEVLRKKEESDGQPASTSKGLLDNAPASVQS